MKKYIPREKRGDVYRCVECGKSTNEPAVCSDCERNLKRKGNGNGKENEKRKAT